MATLSVVLLMFLDARDLPRFRSRDLRMSIDSSVFSPNKITNRGLFEFLSYLTGLSPKDAGIISDVMAVDNLRHLVGGFVGENMQGTEWVPIDPGTVQDVFNQQIGALTSEETLNTLFHLSRWPGMECYFINLWTQSTRDRVNRASLSFNEKSRLYRKWRSWRSTLSWPFTREHRM